MQRNSIAGNVAKIMVKNAEGTWDSVQSVKGGENGTKVFVTIADHYWSKSKGEQITRFVPMQGFVPQNLTIQVGMLVDAEFVINKYKKDGISNVSMDITHWDVSLRSANRQQAPQQAAAGKAASSEAVEAKAAAKAKKSAA